MNRRFDNLGRISIPKEMRDNIGLPNGSEAKIELVGNKIVISNPNEFDLVGYIKEQMKACSNDKVLLTVYKDILDKLKK